MAGVENAAERVRIRCSHSSSLLLPQFLDVQPSLSPISNGCNSFTPFDRYNVNFPTMYASESENKDAKLFNCVQRGHQNSLEMMPKFFMLMIVGGIRHPLICARRSELFMWWVAISTSPATPVAIPKNA
ncbi:microsomal glutathione s-transferase [Actinidia rufa]|uniref:Microsomal glutathione s-transferase n=1 Tax=Actinidia rufa TaxID=165716 RepID=A0A7J0DPN2_9ERIC|nr:microsomal glutathione s-transferase [Actinidia rufa]